MVGLLENDVTQEVIKATLIILVSIIIIGLLGAVIKMSFRFFKSCIFYFKLKDLLLNNEFHIMLDPRNNRKMVVTFNKDKTVGKGQNKFINKWNLKFHPLRKNVLIIKQEDKSIYGRFEYYVDDRVFGLLNDLDIPSRRGQFIEKKYLSFDDFVDSEEPNKSNDSLEDDVKQLKKDLDKLGKIVGSMKTFLNRNNVPKTKDVK